MVRLRAIGECVIEVGDIRLGPDAEIVFSLLAYLVVHRGRTLSRADLTSTFWPDQDDAKARHCLRQAVYKLRRMGVRIETQHGMYLLPMDEATADLDSITSVTKVVEISHAVPGEFVLPGFTPSFSAAFLMWLEALRSDTSLKVRRMLIDLVAEARRRNNWDECARLAKLCLRFDPLNEEAVLTLAEDSALRGNKKEAVRLLDDYLSDLGPEKADLRLPATLLRSRIAERVAFPATSQAVTAAIVGRESTLALLHNFTREVMAGSGQVCVIYGDAGIGKTRLVTDFSNAAVMNGLRVVRASCRSDSHSRALSVFMDLAPSLLRLPGALGCDPDALGFVRRLSEFTPRVSPDPELYDREPGVHTRLRASLQELIDAVTAERPLILIIEDIQWIDSTSLSVVKQLAHSNTERPLLLVVTARSLGPLPDFVDVNQRHVVQHRLEGLGDAASRLLALRTCDALGMTPSPAIIDWCVERCDGNPLLITQLLAHFRDTGDKERVPASLEAVIRERLGALSATALRVLQAIALAAPHSTFQSLEEVLGLQRWDILNALTELDVNGLIVRTPEGLIPKHDLIATAALERLSPSGAAYLHHSIALSLEASMDSSGSPQPMWEAAKHWEAAGNSARAASLAGQRADHLAAMGLAHEAGVLLRQAIDLTRDPAQMLKLYERRSHILRMAGEFTEMQRNAECALRCTGHESARHSIHEVHLLEAQSGHFGVADGSALSHALRCASDRDAPTEHRLHMATWGLAACYSSCDATGAAQLVSAIADIEPASLQEQKSALECTLIYHVDFGDLERARVAADRLVSMERNGRPFALSRALRVAASPHRISGAISVAQSYLDEAYDIALSARLPASQTAVLIASAHCACDLGDYQLAHSYTQRAASILTSHPYINSSQYYLIAAEIALMQNDRVSAAALLAKAAAFPRGPARYEFDRTALKVHLDLQEYRPPDNGDLDRLMTFHRRLRPFFGQDYASAVLFLSLHRSARSLEAAQLIREYLGSYRRMRSPVRNPLLVAISREVLPNDNNANEAP